MRYLLIILSLFLFSCTTTSIKDMQPQGHRIQNNLKPLKIQISIPDVNTISNKNLNVLETEDRFLSIFERTLEKNIFDDDPNLWGSIEIKTVYYQNDVALNAALFYTPLVLMGLYFIPLDEQKLAMEFDIIIYNSKKEKIKKYTFNKTKNKFLSLGYPNLINELDAFHKVLRDFEYEINLDADFINSELEKAGKITN